MRAIRWLPLALFACADLLTVPVETSASTVVEGQGTIGGILNLIEFAGFSDFDVVVQEELSNQGVEEGEIQEAYLTEFTLSTPDAEDLAFIETFAVFVEAEGQPRTRIAHQEAFPEGVTLVEMALDDVDLAPYIVAPSMTITTEVTANAPVDDTTVDADIALEVVATAQGACNAAREQAAAE